MTDIAGKLQKEIQDVAKPYLDQIQELEALARNKRQAVTELSQEAGAKEQEIESLKAEAQATLGRGGDPRPLLAKASSLKGELEDLQGFISEAGQPDQDEQAKIQELKSSLATEVHKRIAASKTLQDQSKSLMEAMQTVVQVNEAWQQAVSKLCADLGVSKKNHRLLEFKDTSEERRLADKINAFSSKYSHLVGGA